MEAGETYMHIFPHIALTGVYHDFPIRCSFVICRLLGQTKCCTIVSNLRKYRNTICFAKSDCEFIWVHADGFLRSFDVISFKEWCSSHWFIKRYIPY